MDFLGVQHHIMALLKDKLSAKLHYHSIHHTIDVLRFSELLAVAEGVSGDDLTILETAAIFHDTGFIEKYDDNEKWGCNIAGSILPDFGYTEKQIAAVCDLIMATRIPQRPKNLLGEIICDADLDYLGTYEFFYQANLLRMELEEHGRKFTDAEWLRFEIDFLNRHHYWTKTSIMLREPRKKKFMEELNKQLNEIKK